MNNYADKSVICFGEFLWDVLPSGKKPGGAPMNVAYHLHKLGINSQVISCIGMDQLGAELLHFLKEIGLSTDYIQQTTLHNTSQVLARIDAHHEVSYDIVYPVAWDFIAWKEEYAELLEKADAFIFGSLASRNIASRETLFKMLECANYRVFDVNLRAPHYTQELITSLLYRSEMVKMNVSELNMVAHWYNNKCIQEIDCMEVVLEHFNIREMVVTRGSKGAMYYAENAIYEYPAYIVEVNDTVGSGDSFLAAFLAMKLGGRPIEDTLDYAVAMGAFITEQSGACPPYSKFDLNRFIWKRNAG